MGDYSPKKHLPLRQSVHRPTFKYSDNSPSNKPVHLFSPSDIQSLKYGGFTTPFQTDLPGRNAVISLESVRNATHSRLSNPYQQPFSLKQAEQLDAAWREPVMERRASSLDRSFDRRISFDRLSAFDQGRLCRMPSYVGNISPISASVIQTNSFLRPQSVAKKEETTKQEESTSQTEDDTTSEDDNDPVNATKDATQLRSFVLFPTSESTNSYDLKSSKQNSIGVGLVTSESVNKSLQRPLSGATRSRSPTRADLSPSLQLSETPLPKSILKTSKDAPYSSGNDHALKRHVILNTTPMIASSTSSGSSLSSSGTRSLSNGLVPDTSKTSPLKKSPSVDSTRTTSAKTEIKYPTKELADFHRTITNKELADFNTNKELADFHRTNTTRELSELSGSQRTKELIVTLPRAGSHNSSSFKTETGSETVQSETSIDSRRSPTPGRSSRALSASRPSSSSPSSSSPSSSSPSSSSPTAASSVSSPQKQSPIRISNSPSSPQSQSHTVRNPRYTPMKPYDEVKDPVLEISTTELLASIIGRSSTETSRKDSQSLSGLQPSGRTGTQISHSLYSNTSSKSLNNESVVNEQRPRCDGAPAEVASKDVVKPDVTNVQADNDLLNRGERLPGDGETSEEDEEDDDDTGTEEDVADDDDDDDNNVDDCVDNMDDDVVNFSGDDSDGYSITSSLSNLKKGGSASLVARIQSSSSSGSHGRSRDSVRHKVTSSSPSRKPPLSGLTSSLFTGVPPTIRFVTQDERVELVPWDIRKFFKWRLSPITPNIVKSTIARSGFRITKRNYDWIGCWGRHMKAQCFKTIRDYQKINHFPGTFQIGRKDRLWRNLYKLQLQFGKREFGFFPQTYVLPADFKLLKRNWEENTKQKWIIKPPASARGIGIKVIHKWAQIPKRRPVIVQKYLAKPYLINESKFDLRIYVYVTSYDPLRVYVFEDGLVRFASQKYSSSLKNLSNKFMHLTNYSINKRNSEYQSNMDETVCQGHKWGLKALWGYLKNNGVNTTVIWENIKDVIIKCIICAEAAINSQIKSSVKRRYSVHELFGFDIFLDEHLKPWILEVNISPSLHSNSPLDVNIKGTMIKDLMNLAGFMVPDKRDIAASNSTGAGSDIGLVEPSSEVCINRKLWQQQLSADERAKHAYYVSRYSEQLGSNILEILTPDDVRMLIETLDENNRRGDFLRVFPSSTSSPYLRYFEQPRYYNLLLDTWIHKYERLDQKGIQVVETYCRQNLHTASPTLDASHQWVMPSQLPPTPRTQSAPPQKPRDLTIRTSFQKKPAKLRRKPGVLHSMSLSSVSSLESKTTSPSQSRDTSQTRESSLSLSRSQDTSPSRESS